MSAIISRERQRLAAAGVDRAGARASLQFQGQRVGDVEAKADVSAHARIKGNLLPGIPDDHVLLQNAAEIGVKE